MEDRHNEGGMVLVALSVADRAVVQRRLPRGIDPVGCEHRNMQLRRSLSSAHCLAKGFLVTYGIFWSLWVGGARDEVRHGAAQLLRDGSAQLLDNAGLRLLETYVLKQ